ncbi:MAG: hypothetical protein Phog2KO_22990 [Phototrophicaceae bacterium]
MISFYREVWEQNRSIFYIRASNNSINELVKILGFSPNKNTNPNFFEQSHYFSLRDPQKIEIVRTYLSSHFVPPEVNLTIFKTNNHISTSKTSSEWEDEISNTIFTQLQKKDYWVKDNRKAGKTIFSKKQGSFKACSIDSLSFIQGVSYRIIVTDAVYISLDIAHGIVQNDKKIITLQNISQNEPYKYTTIYEEFRAFSTHDTDSFFRMARGFVKLVNKLNLPVDIRFNTDPLSATDLGYETWLWSHDYPIALQLNDNQIVSSAKDILEQEMFFYREPQRKQILLLVSPDNSVSKWYNPFWSQLESECIKIFSKIVKNPPPIHAINYSLADLNMQKVVGECKDTLSHYSKDVTVSVLLVIPPRAKDANQCGELSILNTYTLELNTKLRKLAKGCYISTLNWDNLVNKYDREYIIENTVLKLLTIQGGIGWICNNMPVPTNLSVDEIAFIGVDINIRRKRAKPKLAGCIFDGYGKLQAYHMIEINNPKGDVITTQELSALLKGLLINYETATTKLPKQLFIHRDGKSEDNEINFIESIQSELDIKIDLIDIRKREQLHLQQVPNSSGTPSRDLCVGSDNQRQAIMTNTQVVLENNTKLPAPQTFTIVHRFGTSSMKLLAAQVHALSMINYNNFRRTNRFPITICYADALANRGKLSNGEFEQGTILSEKTTLTWI